VNRFFSGPINKLNKTLKDRACPTSEKEQKAIFKGLQISPFEVPQVISYFMFQISKGSKSLFSVQDNCLQILTRLTQN
jgi:hypothetical protein